MSSTLKYPSSLIHSPPGQKTLPEQVDLKQRRIRRAAEIKGSPEYIEWCDEIRNALVLTPRDTTDRVLDQLNPCDHQGAYSISKSPHKLELEDCIISAERHCRKCDNIINHLNWKIDGPLSQIRRKKNNAVRFTW